MFDGIVRDYQAQSPDAEFAAVIVEVSPATVAPHEACFREQGMTVRQDDGPKMVRAVECMTDEWQAWEVAHYWRDSGVLMGCDAGRAAFEQIDKEEPY